jgi:serine/threonine protein kinase
LKNGGVDAGRLYAMKVMIKRELYTRTDAIQHAKEERLVFEKIRGAPFLVNLHYAFHTNEKLYLVMGEYIKL